MGGKNKNKKRPAPPKPGDPDYKTPTQLRNARKRRKLQRDRAQKDGGDKKDSSSSEPSKSKKQKISGQSSSCPKDPSLRYIDNPKAAPTVKAAKRFFENIFRNGGSDGSDDFNQQQHSYTFPLFVGPKTGWRSVARLAVRPGKNQKVKIGLFVPGSHELLEVPDCPAHHPRVNDAVKAIQQTCNQVHVKAFDEHSGNGNLRYVAVSVERATKKQQVVLVWKEDDDKDAAKPDQLIQHLIQKSDGNDSLLDLHSLWMHYNNAWKHANSIFDRNGRWEQRYGDDNEQGVEEILLNANDSDEKLPHVPLYFPPQVFRQANIDAFAKIVLKIREWLTTQRDATNEKKKRLGNCLELYGGVGTIGLNLVDLFESIESSDENPCNKACFEASVKKAIVKGKQLKASRQDKIVYQSKSATAMVQGRKGRESLDKADVIIVDPPRKGLDPEVVEALNVRRNQTDVQSGSPLQTLVYVSCGFDAFRRDYEALAGSARWKLKHAEGHILFPGSDAIETLAIFTKETR